MQLLMVDKAINLELDDKWYCALDLNKLRC